MESALCSTLAELELMRIDAGYMIVVDRLPGEQPRMCAQPSGSYHGVTLELATAVSADDVDVVLLHAGRGWADVETTGGDFHLSIGSGRREYLAGEAVEIDAELRYFGPADSIELNGSNSGLVAFRIEQLDGDLATGPGWDDACQGYELSMDTPLQVPFEKSGGYSHDDPNAEFYRDFFEEPELRLPPGIWRISAIAHFAIGECGGEQVELTASLIVRATATAASPSPTPEPTASPEPPPSPAAAARTLDCPYQTAEGRPLEVEIVDNTGLVSSCTAWPGGNPGVPMEISNPVGDAQVLNVTWQVPCISNLMPAQLQLWNRDPAARRYGQTFLLTVDRLQATGPQGCFDALAGQRVQLTLNAPIDSADVEGQFMVSGRGTDWTETEAGWFGLDITADKSEYLANEPIDVEAKLTYQGPSQVIGVTGSGSGLIQFAIEQLDGNLYLGQGSTDDCSSYELTSDSPLRQQYVKAHGYDAADPNAEFIRRYLEDPNVGLPAGTWRITAYSGFMVGDCDGSRIDLMASVIVQTH